MSKTRDIIFEEERELTGKVFNFHEDINSDLHKEEVQTSKFSRSLYSQCTVSAACCLLAVTCGMNSGHAAVLLPAIQSNYSTLPTDRATGAWIASLQSMMMPVGSILGGILVDRCGRRRSSIMVTLTFVIGWVTISLARTHFVLFLGKIINGLCKGITETVNSVVIDEFSEPLTRGTFSSTLVIASTLGTLIIYGLGTYLSWNQAAGFAVVIPLMSAITFFFIPESAVWLARKGKFIETLKTLHWLYGKNNKEEAEHEYDTMIQNLQDEEKITSHQTGGILNRIKLKLKILATPNVLKPFLISSGFIIAQIFCGTDIFVVYAVYLISLTNIENSGLSSHNIAFITAGVRLVAITILAVLTYHVGRRPLCIFSGLGCSFASIALSIVMFLQLQEDKKSLSPNVESWVIFVLLILYVGANSSGFYVLPYTLTGEMLPGKVRGYLCGVIYAICDLCSAVSMRVFPLISEALHAQGIFMIFGVSSLLCTLYVFLFIPETRKRSLIEMENYFKHDNVMWITRKIHRRQQAIKKEIQFEMN